MMDFELGRQDKLINYKFFIIILDFRIITKIK